MSIPAEASPASRLCSACGLCCSGVMFHTVRLQPRDSAKELAATGLKLKRRNKHHYIQQPCPAHCGSECSIYHQRPERCRIFECRQLISVAAGEKTEAAALARIGEVQQQAAHIEALLHQGGGTDPKRPLSKRYEKIMVELLTDPLEQANASLRAELTRSMLELDAVLDEEFRLPNPDSQSTGPSTESLLVAAYGTLMRGQAGQRLAGIEGQMTYVGSCALSGLLYDVGEYPGFMEGNGEVQAELYALQDAATLAALDEYEGCREGDPHALFTRRRVAVPGQERECWVYYYNGDVAALPQIADGSWLQHVIARETTGVGAIRRRHWSIDQDLGANSCTLSTRGAP